MKTYDSINDFTPPDNGIVICIGKADGLHLGHIALINETLKLAHEMGCDAGILSLIPDWSVPDLSVPDLSVPDLSNPATGEIPLFVLTLDERRQFLANWPLDHLLYQSMTTDFTSINADDFIKDILLNKLGVRGVVVGWDFRFGNNRTGDVELLQKYAEETKFKLRVVKPVTINNTPVKTTLVRELIETGKFQKAQNLLGYPFFIKGKVVSGRGLGQKLGFPTANIDIPKEKLIPCSGVHFVRGLFDDEVTWGLASIGRRPTVEDNGSIVVEVWLKDYDGNLVGREIKIEFFKHLRNEIKFPSTDELKRQIQKDADELDKYLKEIQDV
jgi:riboflavin kinase/FMN adenylyltransferase